MDFDASIIFSDILVVPQALGMTVEMIPGKVSTTSNQGQYDVDLSREYGIMFPDLSDFAISRN